MEAVILMGLQVAGQSSFCADRFERTHDVVSKGKFRMGQEYIEPFGERPRRAAVWSAARHAHSGIREVHASAAPC